jgi:hypothetical protein
MKLRQYVLRVGTTSIWLKIRSKAQPGLQEQQFLQFQSLSGMFSWVHILGLLGNTVRRTSHTLIHITTHIRIQFFVLLLQNMEDTNAVCTAHKIIRFRITSQFRRNRIRSGTSPLSAASIKTTTVGTFTKL